MEAAPCRGGKSGGGTTVGILPGLGEARNALVVRAAEVLIAIGGEFGTLSAEFMDEINILSTSSLGRVTSA